MVGFQSSVCVPSTRTACTMLNLNETNAALHQSSSRQQLHSKVATVRLIDSVQRLSLSRLAPEIDNFGN